MAAEIAAELPIDVPHEHGGAGLEVLDTELLAEAVERRDRVAGAVSAEKPGVAALWVDGFEQRQLDQLIGAVVVQNDFGELLPQRCLVARGPQVHPRFAKAAR